MRKPFEGAPRRAIIFSTLLVLGLINCSTGKKSTEIVFLTNGPGPFWAAAEAGLRDASVTFNAHAIMSTPQNGSVGEQKRLLEDAITRGVSGIAISAADPKNEIEMINQAAAKTNLITQDSDAPSTNRLAYIGTNNYSAGRLCGELIKKALPSGGKIVLFVPELDSDNARKRRQGIIDELLGRSSDPNRYDLPTSAPTGNGYTILATVTDSYDQAKAKANAEDTLTRYHDLGAMVGLFSYNAPMCLEGLRQMNRLGKVKVVAFEDVAATLDAIEAGNCQGTIVQNPYEYGFESVRILAALARGDKSVLPANGFLEIPARMIETGNVAKYRSDMDKLLEKH